MAELVHHFALIVQQNQEAFFKLPFAPQARSVVYYSRISIPSIYRPRTCRALAYIYTTNNVLIVTSVSSPTTTVIYS